MLSVSATTYTVRYLQFSTSFKEVRNRERGERRGGGGGGGGSTEGGGRGGKKLFRAIERETDCSQGGGGGGGEERVIVASKRVRKRECWELELENFILQGL